MFGKAYSAIGSVFNKITNPFAKAVDKTAKVYKELPKEYQDKIDKKIEDVSKGVRTDYPGSVKEFLNTIKDIPIHTLSIMIEPLPAVVSIVADKLTAGEATRYAQDKGFDGFFHAGLIVNNEYAIEKSRYGVSVTKNKPRGGANRSVRVLYYNVPLKGGAPPLETKEEAEGENATRESKLQGVVAVRPESGLTIGSLLEATQKMMGDKDFFSYDVFTGNCQQFVVALLKANGLLTPEAERFVDQDAAELGKKMPGWSPSVARLFTDVANLISIARNGR